MSIGFITYDPEVKNRIKTHDSELHASGEPVSIRDYYVAGTLNLMGAKLQSKYLLSCRHLAINPDHLFGRLLEPRKLMEDFVFQLRNTHVT